MYDLICVGNISIDLYFQGEALTYKDNRFQLVIGGKYFVNTFYQGIGGGGLNAAIGAQRHGLKTAVFGKIGANAFKNMILYEFEQSGVDASLCQMEQDYMNISSILLSDSGERAIVNFNTPHQHMFEDDSAFEKCKKTKAVYLGNLPDVSFTQRSKLLHFLKKENILTIVNLGAKDCKRPEEQIAHFIKGTDILIVNSHEYAELTKRDYGRIHFENNPVKLDPYLDDTLVVITDGEKGSWAYQGDKVYYQKAEKAEHIVDTTGAGDAYTAAFIAEYMKTKDIQKAMQAGANYAVKILQKLGAN